MGFGGDGLSLKEALGIQPSARSMGSEKGFLEHGQRTHWQKPRQQLDRSLNHALGERLLLEMDRNDKAPRGMERPKGVDQPPKMGEMGDIPKLKLAIDAVPEPAFC